jgi:transposase
MIPLSEEDSLMGSAVRMRTDYSAGELRRLVRVSKDVRQSGRLLSQRDWVHRFNESGPDGLLDRWSRGPQSRLSPEQLDELAEIVETGPDATGDGVVRWRRVDLQRVIEARFGVAYHERYVSTLLKKLGFSHMSARPRHPAQDGKVIEAFKKTSRAR